MTIVLIYFLFAYVFYEGQAAFSPSEVKMLEDSHTACMMQTGITKEYFDQAVNGNFGDDKVKAHAFCFEKKIGLMNDAGDIQESAFKTVIYAHMDKAKADLVMSKCLMKKSSPEETAFELAKCCSCSKCMKLYKLK